MYSQFTFISAVNFSHQHLGDLSSAPLLHPVWFCSILSKVDSQSPRHLNVYRVKGQGKVNASQAMKNERLPTWLLKSVYNGKIKSTLKKTWSKTDLIAQQISASSSNITLFWLTCETSLLLVFSPNIINKYEYVWRVSEHVYRRYAENKKITFL